MRKAAKMNGVRLPQKILRRPSSTTKDVENTELSNTQRFDLLNSDECKDKALTNDGPGEEERVKFKPSLLDRLKCGTKKKETDSVHYTLLDLVKSKKLLLNAGLMCLLW